METNARGPLAVGNSRAQLLFGWKPFSWFPMLLKPNGRTLGGYAAKGVNFTNPAGPAKLAFGVPGKSSS